MAKITIAELAQALAAEAAGDQSIEIDRADEPARAGPADLAVAMDPAYLDGLARSKARAAILPAGTDWREHGLEAAIFVGNPRVAMAGLTQTFAAQVRPPAAIVHATAVISPGATIGQDVSVGPNAVIEAGASVGDDCRIGMNVWIGPDTAIGASARIGAGVSIGGNVEIGARFCAHPGVVIGADGFSFVARDGAGRADTGPSWTKIHSLGGVAIGEDVEIGANSSVDAGTLRPTSIGDGTKIDALVQVGHNVQIGRNCLLCAHVAVGGSAIVGDNSVLAGQVGVADNVSLGRGVIAGGATKILTNVPAGRTVLGYPAMKIETHVETYKALRRLPRLMARLASLEKAISKTEQRD